MLWIDISVKIGLSKASPLELLHKQLRLALLLSCLLMVCNSRTTSYRQQTHSFSPFVQLAGAHRNQMTSATNVF